MHRHHHPQRHTYLGREELDLICFGNPELDRIHADNSDGKLHLCAGGPAANTAAAFAGLGGKVSLVGYVSNDKPGKFLLARLKKTSIDTSYLPIDGHPTVTNEIRVTPMGRHIIDPNRRISTVVGNGDIESHIISAKAMLISLSDETFGYYADMATKNNLSLYVSAHQYRKENARDGGHDLRRYNISAIIGDKREMEEVKTRCDLVENTTLATTMAEKGSRCLSNQIDIHAPAFPVESVDPTGAGDAFAAGYIYADLIMKLFAHSKLLYGNACGTLAIMGYGAQQNITMERVDGLLRKHGYI